MPEEKANVLKGTAVCYATTGPWGDFYCLMNDNSICRIGKNFSHTSFQFHRRIFIKWGIWAFCHMIYTVKHVTKAFSLFSVGAQQNFSMASLTLLLNNVLLPQSSFIMTGLSDSFFAKVLILFNYPKPWSQGWTLKNLTSKYVYWSDKAWR